MTAELPSSYRYTLSTAKEIGKAITFELPLAEIFLNLILILILVHQTFSLDLRRLLISSLIIISVQLPL